MSYFHELGGDLAYLREGPNFRLNYNNNSGGGQAFLPGKFHDATGNLQSPSMLDGKFGVFRFDIKEHDTLSQVYLDDQNGSYEIKPRSAGNKNMKLSVDTKENPGRVISAFLMLPSTCAIRTPDNLDTSVLAQKNFWLQTMDLDVDQDALGADEVALIVKTVVFSGGKHKDQPNSSQRNFRLDLEQRFRDILGLSERQHLPGILQSEIDKFAEIYRGDRKFVISECAESVQVLMRELATVMPTEYSGTMDPLPSLLRLEDDRKGSSSISEITRLVADVDLPRNRIVFGAPGTGKSFRLENDARNLLANGGEFERVTFHPDYSYAQFVGTYKPVPVTDDSGLERISYRYVPGPFMRVLVKALRSIREGTPCPCLLLIEEINRANTAAVFGDIFQLLDRNIDNVSQFSISPSEDMLVYLVHELDMTESSLQEIRIPDNMFIWASMNSADQGVYPLDTAFKRRWTFDYVGVNDNDQDLRNKWVEIGTGDSVRYIEWNSLRKSINDFLAAKGINEDKHLGPYFLARDIVVPENGNKIESSRFIGAFSHKVLMYLYEDAAKQIRKSVFSGSRSAGLRYSDLVSEFNEVGIEIFNPQIVSSVSARKTAEPIMMLEDDGEAPSELEQ